MTIEAKFKEVNDLHMDSLIEVAICKDNNSLFALIKGKKGVLPSTGRKRKKRSKRSKKLSSNESSMKRLTNRSKNSRESLRNSSRTDLGLNNSSSRSLHPDRIRYYLNYTSLGYGTNNCHSFELNGISPGRKYSQSLFWKKYLIC